MALPQDDFALNSRLTSRWRDAIISTPYRMPRAVHRAATACIAMQVVYGLRVAGVMFLLLGAHLNTAMSPTAGQMFARELR
jgi:hypothetical protein